MRRALLTLAAVIALGSSGIRAQVTGDAPYGKPTAIINLGTSNGASLVRGQWRYSDAQFVAVEHHAPGRDLRPSGPPNRTHDITPHAGAADFDDSGWSTFPAESIEARRGNGKFSFNWYRINLTIPEQVGKRDPMGENPAFPPNDVKTGLSVRTAGAGGIDTVRILKLFRSTTNRFPMESTAPPNGK